MRVSHLPVLLASTSTLASTIPGPGADGKYTITSTNIKASFIPYGASVSNLWVPDKNGTWRDVVLGFDTALDYTLDPNHPHYGSVPGRYANRIKNSTFEIDGTTYNILPNENNGKDTLHGGPDGWDYRNFTVTAKTESSITFSLFDKDGNQGFPGDVVSYITYTLTPSTWHISMSAHSLTKKTPIMLSSHTYWNLDAFSNPFTQKIYNHTISLPHSGQTIGVDGILIPTGFVDPALRGSVNDFWSESKQVGRDIPKSLGNCGTDCSGYDNCFVVNEHAVDGPVAVVSSPWTGIKLEVFTQQEGFQVYSCNGMDGTIPIKKTQGIEGVEEFVQHHGCLVLEVQDWIDGISHPEWQRETRQIFGPGDEPYVLEAKYKFGLV